MSLEFLGCILKPCFRFTLLSGVWRYLLLWRIVMTSKKEILDISALKIYCANRANALVEVLSNRLNNIGESWEKFLPKMFAAKFALILIALLSVATLFVMNINVLVPITTQFSEWASSSLAAFTISIIVMKFVVLSVCLALFTVKRATLDGMLLKFRALKMARLRVVWQKAHFRFVRNM